MDALTAQGYALDIPVCIDAASDIDYLDTLLLQGSQNELMTALGQLARANGGIAKVAETAKVNGTSIYRTFSDKGNPDLRNFLQILRAMNLRLSIQPISTQ